MATRRGKLGRVAVLLLVGGGISVALLFWAKLRVVTNIPRTTYAEPPTDVPTISEPATNDAPPDKEPPADASDPPA